MSKNQIERKLSEFLITSKKNVAVEEIKFRKVPSSEKALLVKTFSSSREEQC